MHVGAYICIRVSVLKELLVDSPVVNTSVPNLSSLPIEWYLHPPPHHDLFHFLLHFFYNRAKEQPKQNGEHYTLELHYIFFPPFRRMWCCIAVLVAFLAIAAAKAVG